MEEMDYFAHSFPLNEFCSLLEDSVGGFLYTYLEDVVGDAIEPPAGEDDFVSPLRVFADDPIN